MTTGFKHVGLLVKRDDHTYEQFLEHWRTVHAELARNLPGLRKYVMNPVDVEKYPDSPIDGFSELWFDSAEAAEAAWASPVGIACYDDVPNFIGSLNVVNIHEIPIV